MSLDSKHRKKVEPPDRRQILRPPAKTPPADIQISVKIRVRDITVELSLVELDALQQDLRALRYLLASTQGYTTRTGPVPPAQSFVSRVRALREAEDEETLDFVDIGGDGADNPDDVEEEDG